MTHHPTRLAAALIPAILGGACKQKLEEVPPAIQLLDSSGAALSTLTFPTTAFGASSHDTFMIQSLSTTSLSVTALQISGTAGSFYSVAPADAGAALPLTLEQDQTASFVVTFAPIATPPVPQGLVPEKATLTVVSNDPTNGAAAIPLSGNAAAPDLTVCWLSGPTTTGLCLAQGPLAIQYGDVPLGRGNTSQPAVIAIGAADGGAPLTVTSVTIDAAGADAGYELVSPIPTLPAVLNGTKTLTYYVALFPKALGAANGNLVIESDDPHFPPASPPQVQLLATVTPRIPPTACEGVLEDAPASGPALTADGGLGAGWAPAPLDTLTVTGIVDAGCSSDPIDPQSSLIFSFSFPDGGVPPGSRAKLEPVNGKSSEAQLQLDLVGPYIVDDVATDLVGLPSPPASVSFSARPRDDIAAQLTWTATADPAGGVAMQVDLHLVRVLDPDAGVDAGTQLTSPNDCWWVNCLANQPRLTWGPGAPTGFGDPLIGTEFGQPSTPFPRSAEAYATLSAPETGAEYDLYVWYFHVETGQGSGACTSDANCTTAAFPHCSKGQCVPSANATLRAFVGSQDVTDGGLTMTLGKPCDLWHAGKIGWLGGGHLPDGGVLPPHYAFTPLQDLTNDPLIGCSP